jgi:pyruvate dehydrogenase E2 component (dihydrolipoamide acetyltransferase)
MTPLNMPQVGQDIATARIVRWYKQEGDAVQKGDIIATVESDKASFDVESEASGVLLKILFQEGEDGEVFKPIAYLGQPGESCGTTPGPSPAAAQPAGAQAGGNGNASRAAPTVEAAPAGSAARKGFSTPSARRRASELGVDVASVRGTGPQGRVTRRDVEAAAAGPKSAPAAAPTSETAVGPVSAPPPAPSSASARAAAAEDQAIPFSRIRRIVAERLSQSKREIPHFYLVQDVDMEQALSWREAFNRTQPARVTITDLVVQAAARALRDMPRLNSYVSAEGVVIKAHVNVGVATAAQDGLMVPAIPDADRLDIAALSREIKSRSEQARQGRLDLDTKGTFTVTSLGMYGTQRFLPIINPPECAILGVGAVEQRVCVVQGLIGVRRQMTVTLACDHRGVNGTEAAEFLGKIRQHLESDYRVA